jgi:hypothetical protein
MTPLQECGLQLLFDEMELELSCMFIFQLLQGTIKVLTLQKQVCILCGVQSFWSLQFAAMWMDIFVQFFVLSPSPMYSYVGRFLAGIAAQFLSHKLVLVIILNNRSTSSI